MLRFARGSTSWLLAPLAAILVLAYIATRPGLSWTLWLALAPAALFLFFMAFFRDPDREVAPGIASPADGRVVFVDHVQDADLGDVERFSIFMHPKDVHVNRFPLDGHVEAVTHIPGKHIPAWDKDSDRNERVETLLRLDDGTRIKVIQIAGALARRIVPYHAAGQEAPKGARMGLIRLGSRCDILVPPGRAVWTAQPGQQVYAGSTSLGTWLAQASPPVPGGAERVAATTSAPAASSATGAPKRPAKEASQ